MGRVLVLGSSNTDLVLKTETLPMPGQTVLGSEFYQAAGGKGANQAVAAARAGAQVTFLGAVGDDVFGDRAVKTLGEESLDLHYLLRLPGVSSGVALIFVGPDGQNQIGVGLGANAGLTKTYIAGLPDVLFEQNGVFVAQLETPYDVVLAGLMRAKQAGMITVFNPAPPRREAGQWECLRYVDVLVVNEHEAREITGMDVAVDTPESICQAAEWLEEAGCRQIVITLGSNGYCLAREKQATFHSAHRVQACDAVAAGDAFVGVLACMVSEGLDLLEATQLANRAAAIAVTRPGAQPSLPRRHEIEAFSG